MMPISFYRGLYKDHSGQLKTHTQPERSQIKFDVSEDEFVQFYPYLPYFVELSIDVVSGLRLQAAAPRHFGGSNRTIIKQAYEMLVSDRTRLADAPIGTLVTLDRIYDLVEGNLPSERQRDISDIRNLWEDDPWPARTAKVIALLEYVRGVPRTERNIAALLYDSWALARLYPMWNGPLACYMKSNSSARPKMDGSCSPPRRKTGPPNETALARPQRAPRHLGRSAAR